MCSSGIISRYASLLDVVDGMYCDESNEVAVASSSL